jgi:uncharacterized protein (UPF0276 family)
LASARPRTGLIARDTARVDWLESSSDHYLGAGGPRRTLLEQLRRDYPIALHGVGLGVAGSDPLDRGRTSRSLAELCARCDPAYVSDHLCRTGFGGKPVPRSLPLAYTDEVMRHVAERVQRVQDGSAARSCSRNATAYVNFRASEMDEAEFLRVALYRDGLRPAARRQQLYVKRHESRRRSAACARGAPHTPVGYLHLAGHGRASRRAGASD